MNGIIITYERFYCDNLIIVNVIDADRGFRVLESKSVRNESQRKMLCTSLQNKYIGAVIRRNIGNMLVKED